MRARSPMVRLLVASGVVVAMTVPGAAWACRCVQRSQVAQARVADAIVLADVNRATPRETGGRRYAVSVVEDWKAKLPASATILTSATNCAADLEEGRRYLLYLRRTATGYTTSLCAGNLPMAQAGTAIAAIRRRYR